PASFGADRAGLADRPAQPGLGGDPGTAQAQPAFLVALRFGELVSPAPGKTGGNYRPPQGAPAQRAGERRGVAAPLPAGRADISDSFVSRSRRVGPPPARLVVD